MFISTIINEKDSIHKKLNDAKSELRNLPKGRIECHRRKVPNKTDQYKWYIVKNSERLYLPKREAELAKKLAYKRVLKSTIANYENQLIAMNIYLDVASGKESPYLSESTRAIIRKNFDHRYNRHNEEVERLANQYKKQRIKELEEWMNADYFNWDNHPDTLTVQSKTGRIVRSRIEASIDESLSEHGLYYRYEDPTILSGKCIYPDFTIIHPRTGKKIIWEHLGRLDKESYREDNYDKFLRYINNGYYPNLNLILTSESPESTLNLPLIEDLIMLFLT